MADKSDTIAKAYHEFYGSVKDTYAQARKLDKTITLQEVKDWFERNFVRKTNLRGFNSYVAQHPNEEYQIDLFFMPASDGEEFQTALLMIDTFSKFMTIIPVKNKLAEDILDAIKRGIANMGKKPKVLYSDDEGSFNSKQAVAYYRDTAITHLITRAHAPVAERAVRTIKNMIYKRMDANPDKNWYDPEILSNALVAYNYQHKHRMTNMTPGEARKDHNTMEVKTQLEMNKLNKRKYPDIAVGDHVRIFGKKKNFMKERHPVWSEDKHKVSRIERSHGQNFYYVENRERPLMRHEIYRQI